MTTFSLKASHLEDIGTMRYHLSTQRVVAAAASRVFDILSTGEQQHVWARGYRQTVWLTPPPYGVGSVRDIRLNWIAVRERFLAWEPGARFAFSADRMTMPLASQMIEDITMRPLSGRETLLVWNVHVTISTVIRPLAGMLVPKVFAPMFDGFAAGLADYAAKHPTRIDG
jgi:hypothetical protein